MAITWADVINVDGALSGVPSDARAAILAEVAAQVNASVWGSKAPYGSARLAAHLGWLHLRANGAAGALSEEHAGPVGQSFASPFAVTSVPAHLATTAHGVEYWRLLRTLSAARLPVIA